MVINRGERDRVLAANAVIANSFGTGIAGGLLCYAVIKLIAGKGGEVSLGLHQLAIPLVTYFATLAK